MLNLNPLGGHTAFGIGKGLAVLRTFFLAGFFFTDFFLAGFFFTGFFSTTFFFVTGFFVAGALFFGVGDGLVAAFAGTEPKESASASNTRSASKLISPTGKF